MAAKKKNKAASKPKTKSEKKANTTKPKQTKVEKPKEENTIKPELVALFTAVSGLLLAVFLYAPAGIVGKWLKSFFLGLLGIPAYLLPFFLMINGVHKGINKKYQENRKKYWLALVGVWVLSGIFHLFSRLPKMNPFLLSVLADYYGNGSYGYGGGIFGGILTDIFRNMVGGIATGILLFTALLVLVMMITKWSPIKALLRVIIRFVMETRNTGKALQEEEAAKYRAEEEVAVRKMPRNGKIPNFSDEEVTRSEEAPKKKMDVGEVPSKPYEEEGYLPEALREVEEIENLDAILEHAIPEPVFHAAAASSSSSFAEAKSDFTNNSGETDDFQSENAEHNIIEETRSEEFSSAQNAENGAAFDTEEKNIIYPEKVEGMEDISDEIEEVFEKIPYEYPSFDLLDDTAASTDSSHSRSELRETAQKLVSTLKSFNVEAKLLNVSKGPTVTRYELKPGEGVKVSKIIGLAEDITLRLAANNVRIAPVPNKEAVGVEIPNKSVDTVHIREVLDSDEFRNFPSKLAFALGKDITGKNVVFDIAKMPHVLIAGATGSGKSVCINTLITSLIYKADPNEVKLLMVDPKVVELGIYNGIPHLLIPVVTDPRRASGALYWAVQEMVRRYAMFAESNVRDIKGYNNMILENGGENTMPHIVIIIDELADLMMVAPNEVEDSICRLAQMARAAGMHLVIATQRPSVDVITGLIKANIPSRIAFAVSSQIDSRTILDSGGAEKLLGRGDMLFSPVGAPKPTRLQGAFISDKEVERVVEFIKNGSHVRYDEDIMEKIENGKPVNVNEPNGDAGDNDELLPRAIEIAVDSGKISASYLQRRLKVGFSRAARMIDQMEERGWIGPPEGSKPREVLISKEDYMEMSMQ